VAIFFIRQWSWKRFPVKNCCGICYFHGCPCIHWCICLRSIYWTGRPILLHLFIGAVTFLSLTYETCFLLGFRLGFSFYALDYNPRFQGAGFWLKNGRVWNDGLGDTLFGNWYREQVVSITSLISYYRSSQCICSRGLPNYKSLE
jgi:hypothetical protein